MSVAIVLLLILVNGLFAMSEIAVVSANRFRLGQKAATGDVAAQRALDLAENPNRFLSTVQVGITLVGVFSGAFGGAALAGPLAERLQRVAWLEPYAQPVAFGLVVAGITYLSLVIGELVPKRIGLSDPDRVATSIAGLMHRLSQIARPVVWLLSVSTEGLVRLFRLRLTVDSVSESDIETLVAQGRQAGVVEPEEQEIIENAFWLGERRVNDIMTPRHQVAWLPVRASPEEIRELVGRSPHGRYLVADGDLDHVVGFVSAPDMLAASLSDRALDLSQLMEEPIYVPETLPILSMLDRFKETGKRLAVVVDEYGGFEGVLTLGDILEELVGDVVADPASDPEVVRVKDGWLVDGGLHVDQLAKLLAVDEELEGAGFQTVGGLVATELGKVPEPGDRFTWRQWQLEVTRMDGQRVAKVRIHARGDEPAEGR